MAIGERYDTILDAALAEFAPRGFHQASVREIARATGLSLAGLYHYVAGKDELLFLVLDRALDTLGARADTALAEADTPQARLLALIRTHLEFGFDAGSALRVVNRDWELTPPAHRDEIVAKRRAYMARWLDVLREIDPHPRSDRARFSAANLLLGMLNGIAGPAFLKTADDARRLAAEVGALFLHGFLEHAAPAAAGDRHDP